MRVTNGATLRGAAALTFLSVLMLTAALPALAQTENVLYNFTGGSDGANPYSGLTSDGVGNFYGATYAGGLGYGVIFELSPNGSGGWNETPLYSFMGGADGCNPGYSGLIFDGSGNLYGTADHCGAYGYGNVFELSPVGGGWTETVLYAFTGGADGANPIEGLIMDKASNLYGTTVLGGSNNEGTVFELSLSGGLWTEQVLYNGSDGIYAGVTMDAKGNIYGASYSTVFELSKGEGGWNATVIHTFAGPPKDGSGAIFTPVLDSGGNVYGTTRFGGKKNDGVVYKLSPKKKGKWTEKILRSFGSGKDGQWGAGIVLDATGNIYGTAEFGGKYGDGIVFELVPSGSTYKGTILWNFNGSDGANPNCIPILVDGGLYGTTINGGSDNDGVVFEVTP